MHGSKVVIYSDLGQLSLDGESLSFEETMRNTFSRAGFQVSASGRRLIGVVELIGLFKAINRATAEAKNSSMNTSFPEPLPTLFYARAKRIQYCEDSTTGLNVACRSFGQSRLIDWVVLFDGRKALVVNQIQHSLTFSGHHIARTVETSPQYPDQELVSIQNETHALSFQTYRNQVYHCNITEDNSLKSAFARRRRLESDFTNQTKFVYKGLVQISGVLCRHWIMTAEVPKQFSSSLKDIRVNYYENYFTKSIFQIDLPQSSMLWRVDDLVSVDDERDNPLTLQDVDMDALIARCDNPSLHPPDKIQVGLTGDIVYPRPEWGAELSNKSVFIDVNVSLPNSSLFNLSRPRRAGFSRSESTASFVILKLADENHKLHRSEKRRSFANTNQLTNKNTTVWMSRDQALEMISRGTLGNGSNDVHTAVRNGRRYTIYQYDYNDRRWEVCQYYDAGSFKNMPISGNVKICDSGDLEVEIGVAGSWGATTCPEMSGAISVKLEGDGGGYSFSGKIGAAFKICDCFSVIFTGSFSSREQNVLHLIGYFFSGGAIPKWVCDYISVSLLTVEIGGMVLDELSEIGCTTLGSHEDAIQLYGEVGQGYGLSVCFFWWCYEWFNLWYGIRHTMFFGGFCSSTQRPGDPMHVGFRDSFVFRLKIWSFWFSVDVQMYPSKDSFPCAVDQASFINILSGNRVTWPPLTTLKFSKTDLSQSYAVGESNVFPCSGGDGRYGYNEKRWRCERSPWYPQYFHPIMTRYTGDIICASFFNAGRIQCVLFDSEKACTVWANDANKRNSYSTADSSDSWNILLQEEPSIKMSNGNSYSIYAWVCWYC